MCTISPHHSLIRNTRALLVSLGPTYAARFFATTRRAPESMTAWLEFLTTHFPAPTHKNFMRRILRPYMRQDFTVAQRCQLIRDHYALMARHFTPHPELSVEPGLEIAQLHGKNNSIYHVHLGGNTSKEGECSIAINDASGGMLAKLAGSIGHDAQGNPIFWIGSLQGAKPPMGRDDIVKATRNLYGLRPKGAALLVTQLLAQELGLTSVRAPDNDGHISQRGYRRLRSKRRIHADYGQFWEEIGGTRIGSAEYALPIIPQIRDISDVKVQKRNEWKKRQTISDALAVQVRAALKDLARE